MTRLSRGLHGVEKDRDRTVRELVACRHCNRPAGHHCDYGLTAHNRERIQPVHTRRYLDGIDAGLVPPPPGLHHLLLLARRGAR